jgi:RHS repeat-associated protein
LAFVLAGWARTTGNDTLTYQYRWNAISEVTMPGNLKRTVTLDALQRPTKIEVKGFGPTPGNNGAPVMNHRYQYDEVSNISQKTSLDGDYVYDYDDLDRLTKAEPPALLRQSPENPDGLPVEGFSYDAVHNREFSAHQPGAWIYNANNELTQWGQGMNKRQLTYDANGSTIKEQQGNPVTETTDYVYDAQDRLVEVKKNALTVAKYAYDPMGRRVWRESEGGVTWFLYSDEGLIEEFASATNTIRTYGWNPGGLWGTDTVWQKDANGTFLTNNDHLYTTDLLTKAEDGEVAWSAMRESFGKTSVRPEAATEYLMRFPGQWEDGIGGFNQNYLREFDGTRQRFISADPLGSYAGPNFYAYVPIQPTRNFDAFGLCWGWVKSQFHYQTGGGRDVSIHQIGCYDEFTKHTSKSRELWKKELTDLVLNEVKSLPRNTGYNKVFTKNADSAEPFDTASNLGWVRGFVVYHKANCLLETFCNVNFPNMCIGPKGIYKFYCQIVDTIKDPYRDLLNFGSSQGQSQDLDDKSKVFNVVGDWVDSISGRGPLN